MRTARRRTAAVGGALALAGILGVGAAAAAPQAAASPQASSGPQAESRSSVAAAIAPIRIPTTASATPATASATPTTAPAAPATPTTAPRTPAARTSTSAASPALTAHGYLRTRLTLSVTGGSVLRVYGRLTRASNGTAAVGRSIQIWTRTADTGHWALTTTVRTTASGRVTYRLTNRTQVQITLRFRGDARFLPAASVTLVPHPSATGMSPGLVRALSKARAAAHRAGLMLVVNSGYRTFSKQERMYEAAVRQYGSATAARKWVLPPQESTHVRGLAADVGTPATAAWLSRHGAAFGLCRAYGDEAWHFEYRPDWIAAFHGRCPAPVPLPGDPDPLSPAPRVAVVF